MDQRQEIDPTDLHALAQAQEEDKQARELQRKVEIDDFLWLVKHEQGRRLVWRLLAVTGVFRNPFVPGSREETDFRCGEQNVGQKLLAEVHELSPESYHLMVRERQKNGSDHGNTPSA